MQQAKTFFQHIIKWLLKSCLLIMGVAVMCFSTVIGYLMAQEFKNRPLYYTYMQKCVDNGGNYWLCHYGKWKKNENINIY